MIYHVLPGDAPVEEFRKTAIEGEVIVCREAFIAGPIDAGDPEQFWDERAKFVLTEYGEDEIVYHEKVAAELEKLADIGPEDEVNLWFEYELFCSVNLWFCLSKLSGSDAKVFRVEPSVVSAEDRWSGFGKLNADELAKCFAERTRLTEENIYLGKQLWDAFRFSDASRLAELKADTFPHLSEVIDAAIEIDTKPRLMLENIKAEGVTDFSEVFSRFSKTAGVYGFGDTQVLRIWDSLY